MDKLIPINSEKQTTSARDLWEFLGKPYTEFMKWFDKYKSYGFAENMDYRVIEQLLENPQGGRPAQDYEITIDMAKELAMLQKTEKGSQARKYFIAIQKAWDSPEMVMKRAMQFLNQKCEALENQIQLNAPKVEFANHVAVSANSLLVEQVANIANKNGIKIGRNRLWEKLREWRIIKKTSKYEPKQEYIDCGYFEVIEGTKETPKGTFTYRTTRVTGKGQIYIINRLIKEREAS